MYKLLLLLALLTPAMAVGSSGAGAIDLNGAQRFAEQKAEVEVALADGETYSEIDPAKRQEVKGALERIAAALKANGGVEGMTEQQKVNLFNDQELVNTILTSAYADSRVICRREKVVGSHRSTNRCESVAERRRAMEEAQSNMQRSTLRRVLDPSG